MKRLAPLLALAACAHSPRAEDLIAWTEAPHAPPALTAEQAAADLDLAVFALREGYGGRKYVAPAQLEAALTSLAALKATPPSTPRELCVAIAHALSPIPDSHLLAFFDGNCADTHDWLVGHVGKNFNGGEKPWAVETRQTATGPVVLISITAMPPHEDPVWSGFLDAIRSALPGARAAIVDLRGNGGGDDTTGYALAELFWGGTPPSPSRPIVSQVAATWALAMNNGLHDIHRREAKHEPVPPFVTDRFERARRGFEDARAGRLPAELERKLSPGDPYDPVKGFDRPVYVLIDRACASSCESTLEIMERHPHLVTVGENSGGFVHFGNLGQAILPNSTIRVQMATDFWRFEDGRYVEKIGYAPKLRVEAGRDALAAALAHFTETSPAPPP